ncbi:hypothetical protein PENSPDRAFT_651936 [Peniophora sp. CONT]|nr:hypothetical protein PENSPDRAFT_651936 [Peniophora sp. CONT]
MPASDSDANAFIDRLVATLDGSAHAGPGTWDQSKRDARFTRILDSLVGYTGRKPVAGNEEDEDEEEWVVIGGSRVGTPSLTNDSASRGAGSVVSEPVIDEPVTLDAILNRPPKRERYLNPSQQLSAHERLRARHGLFSPSTPTYIQPATTMPSKPDYVSPAVQEQRDAEMRARFGLFEPVIDSQRK